MNTTVSCISTFTKLPFEVSSLIAEYSRTYLKIDEYNDYESVYCISQLIAQQWNLFLGSNLPARCYDFNSMRRSVLTNLELWERTRNILIARDTTRGYLQGLLIYQISNDDDNRPRCEIHLLLSAPGNIIDRTYVGVGSTLVFELASIARAQKLSKLFVEPLDSAVSFYVKLGFKWRDDGTMCLRLSQK